MERWHVVEGPDLSRAAWSRYVAGHPQANMFHTPEMMDVYAASPGTVPIVLAAVDRTTGEPGGLIASVQTKLFGDMFTRATSRAVVYGGLLAADDACLRLLLRSYCQRMKNRALFTEVRNMAPAAWLAGPLEGMGFRYLPHLNYVIDLSREDEALWRGITQGARKNIRRTLDRGADIREVASDEELDRFYALIRDTYRRARVPLCDRAVFRAAWERLVPLGRARLWIMHVEGVPVAARAVLIYKGLVFDWYAGSVRRAPRGFYPNETMVWTALQYGRKAGHSRFDFGGAGVPGEPYGVREFKSKFNGELVEYGRYRFVHSPHLMRTSETMYGLFRRFL